MEKRDPLRELLNTSDNNEPQENGKEPKIPETTVSADKENGFGKIEKSDAGKSGCGKLRLSFLKTFDPLYSESAEKSEVSDQTSLQPEARKKRPQLIIEDSDSDRSQVSPLPVDVSDDEAAFVDATFITADDVTSSEKIPEIKDQELEESFLKFYTPEKFSTTFSTDSKDTEKPTSPLLPSNRESVLSVSKETLSTSPSAQNIDLSNGDSTSSSECSDVKSDPLDRSKTSLEVNIRESPQEVSTEEDPVSQSDVKEQIAVKPAEEPSENTTRDTSDSVLRETPSSDQLLDKTNPEKESIEKRSDGDVVEASESRKGLEKVPSDTADTDSTAEKFQSCERQLSEEKPKEGVPKNLNKTVEEQTQEPVEEKAEETVHPSSEEETVQPVEKETSQENPEKEVAEVESPKKDTPVQETEGELNEPSGTQSPINDNTDLGDETLIAKTEEVVHPSSEEETVQPEKETSQEKPAEVEPPKEDIPVHKTEGEPNESSETQSPINEDTILSPGDETLVAKTEDTVHSSSEDEKETSQEKPEKEGAEIESPKKDTSAQKTEGELKESETQSPIEENADLSPGDETLTAKTEDIVHPSSEEETVQPGEEASLEKTEEVVAEVASSKKDTPVQKTEEGLNESSGTSTDLSPGNKTVIEKTEDTVHPSSEGETAQPEKEASLEETEENSAEVESPKKIRATSSPIGENTELTAGDTTAVIHQEEDREEDQHLDSGVESIEESYTKSPSNPEGENLGEDKEDSNLPDDGVLDEEFKVKPEGQSHSDESEDTNTLSEGSIQDEQTSTKIETEKIEEIPDKKSEAGTEKSTSNKLAFDAELKAKMADLSEKLSEQQQENSDLKLQLNASQQAKASLELEIRQKEEVIIKTQAEALKNEQTYKQEIKQLREKLKENSKLIEKDGCKELEEQLKEAKAREAKAIAELNQRTKDDLNYQKIMEEYENTIATRFADYQKLKEENETATRHLANIELAFSDVHQKYERTKALLEGFKSNEETLSLSLQASEKTCKQHEERYESLKAHAKAQIEKSNKEILYLRDKYEADINKLKAIIKRLEIKCSSLEVSLQQKTEECAALAALCDEVTGKRV